MKSLGLALAFSATCVFVRLAGASVFFDFESFTGDADVTTAMPRQPGNGIGNCASASFTLAGVGSGNQYGHMLSTVGTGTTQFRSYYDINGTPDGSFPALGDQDPSQVFTISMQVLSRNTTRSDGTQAATASIPFIQLGFTPNKLVGGIAKNTDALYGEISNDGASIDMNITGSSIALPTGFRTAVTIPGGFVSGATVTMVLSRQSGGAVGAQSVAFYYTDPSTNTVTAQVGPFDITAQAASGQPWASGNVTVPYFGQVRGYSATGSSGVASGDLVTLDVDNVSSALTPEPAAGSLLFLAAGLLLRRRR